MTKIMSFGSNHPKRVSWFLLLMLMFEVIRARNLAGGKTAEKSVSCILIFGDSTVDPGNNNYIGTPFRSDFWPYGKDFVDHTPTGRFTNGRLSNDFLAEYVGVKELVPPYLDPTLTTQDLITGVSFASAGSGFDPLTPTITGVIPMSEQLKYLKEYRAKLEAIVGKDKTKEIINNALFYVSGGTNDFFVNYFTLPIRRKTFTVTTYMNFILEQTHQFLQGLLDQGARRIGVVGLPPIGCLPIAITLFSDHPILNRDCIHNFSTVAREYNQLLQRELSDMQLKSGARIAYLDSYGPLEKMTLGHQYGFEVVNCGCCGTGLLEATFLCNPKSPVCPDASKYVFWDSIHPTQKSYEIMFQSSRHVFDYLVGN